MEIKISTKYEPLFYWLSAPKDDPIRKVDTVIMTGGRNSQKSFAAGLFSCVAAKEFNHRILYTRYTLKSAEDSIIPEFNEKIDILNAHKTFDVIKDRIEGTRNKSKIVFKGIKTSSGNQTANLKSLKDFSMFILEEAEEMPNFDDWDKIKKSIRALDVPNLNILILNPTTKEHWIYKEFFEDMGVPEGFNGIKNNVLYIHTDYLDIEREFVPDNHWNDFEDKRIAYEAYRKLSEEEKKKADPLMIKKAKYFKHVIKGGWLDRAEGVIFSNWVIGEFKETNTIRWGQDYGFSTDPTTLLKVAIDRGHKRLYCKEYLNKPGMGTEDIFNTNLRYAGQDLIYADGIEDRLVFELAARGLNILPATKGPGSLTSGISLLLDYEIIVDPQSINLIKELNNYAWEDKKSKTPIDAFNHQIDSLRYAVYSTIKSSQSDLSDEAA